MHHDEQLEYLFFREVPEIADGIVVIKGYCAQARTKVQDCRPQP
jgi:transcription antitermination factor NusA-like protein